MEEPQGHVQEEYTQSELFCMSLAKEMNSLSDRKRRKLQADIMNLIVQMEQDETNVQNL